jgi:hypothetical protein
MHLIWAINPEGDILRARTILRSEIEASAVEVF